MWDEVGKVNGKSSGENKMSRKKFIIFANSQIVEMRMETTETKQ